LLDAAKANVLLEIGSRANDEAAIAAALQMDFVASMQSVVAAATAVDSFYAALKDFVQIDPQTLGRWRDRGTSRYRQVAEVLRRSFAVKDRNMVGVRSALKQLYLYRDLAVHPARSFHEPYWHPVAKRNTARSFVVYRFHNARELAGVSMSLLSQCTSTATPRLSEVGDYVQALRASIGPVQERWRRFLAD
jgi:hypothetical protein